MSRGALVLGLASALGAGAIGGVFFAFSAFVMNGLARLPPAHGIAAMQSINVTAVRPAFMTALFGTAALSSAQLVTALTTWGDRRAALLLAGSLSYLVGVIGVTVAQNVPRNEALAAVDAGSAHAVPRWHSYLRSWTRWNHVRAAAGVAAAALLVLALVE